MKTLKIIAICLIVIGTAAIGYSIHGMQKIRRAHEAVDFFTSPFSDVPVGEDVSKRLHARVNEYDLPVTLLLGGIASTVAGAAIFYYSRKK
ncbi:MAG: hypothetical protein COT84_01635 [Chlamydiae bacterium CG10_big_fil_rev_8_21_14_0_10_35_9]|nr:MAG: hypothetical protein COT84_01635 [Chlamydiae bacterium CG10_big_fil_rev_8_21_14_0_10_35_9]